MNLGNAVYGLIAAAGLWFICVSSVIFIYAWPITREGTLYATASAIGLCTTIGLKIALTKVCQHVQYRAFFRIRPQGARLSALALECWFIGLGGGVLVSYKFVRVTI